jgi:rhodanese-related sulfurtransferase
MMKRNFICLIVVITVVLTSCNTKTKVSQEVLTDTKIESILSEFSSGEVVLKDNSEQYFSQLNAENTNIISPQKLLEIIKVNKKTTIIDIRKKEDFDKGHIEGATNIFWHDLGNELDQLPTDERFFVTCYSGQAAGQVIGVLKMLDYDVLSLAGGMNNGWIKDKLPVLKSN